MGKLKLTHLSAMLFENMIIGMIFYTHPGVLTLESVERILTNIKITKLPLAVAIKDLVCHGIISTTLNDSHSFSYGITEFGQYFFNKVCQTNEDAKRLCKTLGEYTI